MLFNFTLNPIDEIPPWGPTPHLHWFGLSLGTYYVQAGPRQLLRYSDAWLRYLSAEDSETRGSPFVDYYVARFFEDILDIAPCVLEPIPDELVRYASSDIGGGWKHQCQHWLKQQPDDDNDAWNDYCNAAGWISGRKLHTSYLSSGANLWLWRQDDAITIAWDNRVRLFDDIPVWAEQQGHFALSVQEFNEEVESFRQRFLKGMRERAEAVCRSWSRPEMEIDLEQLVNEQSLREAERLRPVDPPTDWSSVMRAIEKIAGSS